jgi:biopolymer transport protein ExbB
MSRRWFSFPVRRAALVGGCCCLLAALLVALPTAGVSYAQKKKEPEKREPAKNNAKPTKAEEADRQFADRMAAGEDRQPGPQAAPAVPPGTVAAEPPNLFVLWWEGGPIMYPITAMSFLVVLFACERFLGLRRGKVIPRKLVRDLNELSARPGGLDPRQAFQICKQYPSTAANILNAVLVKVGRPHLEVERAMSDASEREAAKLWKNVRPITLATTITPLLGLLGTVEGIILCFFTTSHLPPGANKTQYLAAGIYMALVSTFGGLAVAIPASILAHYFEGRIQARFRQVDDLMLSLMPQLERFEGKVRISRGSSEHGESSTRSGGENPSKRQPVPGS